MKYISTRGSAPPVSFTQMLLAGLAPDGGLYLPEAYPHFSKEEIAKLAVKSYAGAAEAILAPFVAGEIARDALRQMIDDAYAGFDHKAIAPLVQLDSNLFLLELFHGPTLAFKDLAMQLLARMIGHVLKAKGERVTIIGATSGDTGAAAIEAFGGLPQADVFIFYPHGRVSEVQRRQMTTARAANVHVIALEGTFDDAQACVKAMFNDHALRKELNLGGINSINLARILFQTVYYFTSAAALGAPWRQISFCVPTGNFGDIFGGYVAKRMGLPCGRLVIATNSNDILARTLAAGRYVLREVCETQSPSMDIQVSSNFERLLFEAYEREPSAICSLMQDLQRSRRFTVAPGPLEVIREGFDAFSAKESETAGEIAQTFRETGYLADPHTAVGLAAARKARAAGLAGPLIVLATAHPAKFPAPVARASGRTPELPPRYAGLLTQDERFSILPNDQTAAVRFVRAHAGRAA